MDPLSITASISGLLVACAQVVKIASDVRGKYKTASLTISSIATECVTVTTALSHLQVLVIRRADSFDSNTANMFECVITGCKLTLSVLDEYIMELSLDHGELTSKNKAKVVWNESEMKELLQQLRGHESSLNLLLTVMQSQSGTETQDLLRQNQVALTKILARARTSRRKKPPSTLGHSQLAFTDTESILSDAESALSATSFEFDDIIVNSRVYREAMRKNIRKAAKRQTSLLPTGLDGGLGAVAEGNSQHSPVPAASAPNREQGSSRPSPEPAVTAPSQESEIEPPRIRHKFSFESDSTVKGNDHIDEKASPNTPQISIDAAAPFPQSDGPASPKPVVIRGEGLPSIHRKSFAGSINQDNEGSSPSKTNFNGDSDPNPDSDNKSNTTRNQRASSDGASLSTQWRHQLTRTGPPLKLLPDPSSQTNTPIQSPKHVGDHKNFCAVCNGELTGQLDCGVIVISKFFPHHPEKKDGGDANPVALCETDYFRRLDLLCASCGRALRGSYITAMNKKYHIDHFTCMTCHEVFTATDNYYDHDGNPYCQYDYSVQFATRCSGCHIPILTQFVDIERDGKEQSWHPECYMIHKFWNVRLAGCLKSFFPLPESGKIPSREERKQSNERNLAFGAKATEIWSSFSSFEEISASSISDMLMHLDGNFEGIMLAARSCIYYVEVLFSVLDEVSRLRKANGMSEPSYVREAKLFCQKMVKFFSVLSKVIESGSEKVTVTKELLSVVEGMAHYLKLLVRIVLQNAMALESQGGDSSGLDFAIRTLGGAKDSGTPDFGKEDMLTLSKKNSDECPICSEPIVKPCAVQGSIRVHTTCMTCATCSKHLGELVEQARWKVGVGVVCTDCSPSSLDGAKFTPVTILEQYAFLLKVALARLKTVFAFLPEKPNKSMASPRDRSGSLSKSKPVSPSGKS
ncbi:hypothetical protein AJ79_03510 [Helicocarpus griseus UAMH5409]|uniref:LIM zinc-binding domain-containing protein n=1 Tax=Helicocarpus griseus UAMH5409 TaxID=1447875 RepID=A0A2B7XYG3_9EURO|nr:hypothetical protein AJ79_03510 [Helicocarpus griseus UAMH5409]